MQTRVIGCRRCLLAVADQSDIFAMSVEGPQGTYVNPNGYVHETLTVYKAKDMITRGLPSTEASWFPGSVDKLLHNCIIFTFSSFIDKPRNEKESISPYLNN